VAGRPAGVGPAVHLHVGREPQNASARRASARRRRTVCTGPGRRQIVAVDSVRRRSTCSRTSI
jgi:hypothetical protein